jgi:hypothetical protein
LLTLGHPGPAWTKGKLDIWLDKFLRGEHISASTHLAMDIAAPSAGQTFYSPPTRADPQQSFEQVVLFYCLCAQVADVQCRDQSRVRLAHQPASL